MLRRPLGVIVETEKPLVFVYNSGLDLQVGLLTALAEMGYEIYRLDGAGSQDEAMLEALARASVIMIEMAGPPKDAELFTLLEGGGRAVPLAILHREGEELDSDLMSRIRPDLLLTVEISLEVSIQQVLQLIYEYKGVRRSARVQVEMQVELEAHGDVKVMSAHNLSRNGIFLRTLSTLSPGTPVTLRLVLPGRDTPHLVLGKILYRLVFDEQEDVLRDPDRKGNKVVGYPGMAVLFSQMPPAFEYDLERFLAQHG